MECKTGPVEEHERKMKEYEREGYKHQFDMFALKHFYSYFNFLSVGTFLELFRHLSKLFLTSETELVVMKMNRKIIDKEIDDIEQIVLLEQFLRNLTAFQMEERHKGKRCFFNLFFLFLHSTLICARENKLLKSQHLQAVLESKVISNFANVFNAWSGRIRFSSMDPNHIQQELRRLHDLRYKNFKIERIYKMTDLTKRNFCGSDEEMRSNLPCNYSEVPDTYVDEIEFIPNEDFQADKIEEKIEEEDFLDFGDEEEFEDTLRLMERSFTQAHTGASDVEFWKSAF